MFYKVEVYDDGDIFITKTENAKSSNAYLYFKDIGSLQNELMDYGAVEIEDDLQKITSAKINEPVQCY